MRVVDRRQLPARPSLGPRRSVRLILGIGLVLTVFGVLTLVSDDRQFLFARSPTTHLYVLSVRPSTQGDFFTGEVNVVDPASGQEIQSFPAGTAGDVDTVSSPDGARIYVAGGDVAASAGGSGKDFLTAFDRTSGRQLWRTTIQHRVKYHDDTLTTLVASADGRYLYLYSIAEVPRTDADSWGVTWWLQPIDAATGRTLPETIPLPECGSAAFQLVPGSNTLIASCFELSDLRVIDLPTYRVEQSISVLGPGTLVGSAMSPDGRWLYAVTDMLQVAVVDLTKRSIAYQITLDPHSDRQDLGFVALTPDGTRLVVGEYEPAIEGIVTAVDLQAYDTGTWQQVAQLRVNYPFFALAPASAGHGVYAWGGLTPRPEWTPGSVVYAIDVDRQSWRPFLKHPSDDIVRVVTGP